jgi:hypothetical protein
VKLGPHTTGRTKIEGILKTLLRRIFGPKRKEMTGGWQKTA